jgi:Mn2+/Fe2+ NRAMP family transporter
MNPIPAIVRIVIGLAILILAYTTYSKNSQLIAANAPSQIFGYATGATSGQLNIAFALCALFGLFLLLRGIATLLKSRQ